MELDDVEGLFAEVDELRKNGWQKATTSVDQLPIQSSPEHGPQPLATKPPVSSRMVKSRGAVAAAPAANNEAKKAAEAKRKRELAEAIRKQKERMLQEKNASGECVQSAGRFIC
ncbi:hypothetical protein Tcan_02216 [Toxocara canis]|nr:hypothetical protein Tcan_02216 [Toxocara canis]